MGLDVEQLRHVPPSESVFVAHEEQPLPEFVKLCGAPDRIEQDEKIHCK